MAQKKYRWKYNQYIGNSPEGGDHDVINEIPKVAKAIGADYLAVFDLITGDTRTYIVNGHRVEVSTMVLSTDSFTQCVEHTFVVG